MGSFRSPAARAMDTALLTSAECSALGENEWVRYWKVLPHSAAVRLADEGTIPVMDPRGRRVVDVRVRAGTLDQIKLEEGIVGWQLVDEAGNPAPGWDKALANELLGGLDNEVKAALRERIGAGEPAALDDVVDEDGTTEGEGYAGN